jgi:hypothetical protein
VKLIFAAKKEIFLHFQSKVQEIRHNFELMGQNLSANILKANASFH